MTRLLSDAGIDASMRRIYWYTDRPDSMLFDEQIVRALPAVGEPAPGGAGSASEPSEAWAAIERDLLALSQAQAYELIVIGSDDERLREAIDQAQLRGASVCLLADDSLSDFAALRAEEPDWAALLALADRRLMVRASDLSELLASGTQAVDGQLGTRANDEQAMIEEVVRSWWDEQTPDAREDLRAALQLSPGIPQDVDRALLLQSRERFVRPLSFGEKKLMRECLREVAASSSDQVQEEPSLV
jgi:hypothetical protein